MSGGRSTRFRGRRSVLAAALLVACGCVRGQGLTLLSTGAEPAPEALRALRDGQTTRREVLDGLGPPLVVVRDPRGTVLVPRSRNDQLRFSHSPPNAGWEEVAAASFFERFAGRVPVAPGDVVYFYRERAEHTTIISRAGKTNRFEDRLWILVDGRTGLVKAHVHEHDGHPRGEPVAGDGGAATPAGSER